MNDDQNNDRINNDQNNDRINNDRINDDHHNARNEARRDNDGLFDDTDPSRATMRHIAGELGNNAPTATPWAEVMSRADHLTPDQMRAGSAEQPNEQSRRTPVLLLVAASVAVLAIGFAALANQRGSDRLQSATPPPSDSTGSTLEPAPTTTDPLFAPVPDSTTTTTMTPASNTIAADTETSTTTTTIDDVLTETDETTTTTVFVDPPPPADAPPPVDLPTTPASEIQRMPAEAWAVLGAGSDDYTVQYAVDEGVGKRIVYSGADGSELLISSDQQGFVSGEPIDVAGVEWLLQQLDDGRAVFQRDLSGSMINVEVTGRDVASSLPLIQSLIVGGDSVLPIEPLRPYANGQPADVFAIDVASDSAPDNWQRSDSTFSGVGINGWYCVEVFDFDGGFGGCGYSRGQALSSDIELMGGGSLDDDDWLILTLSSIVSPDVATVEVVFDDGTTATATPTDLSGKYDDRFWILTVRLADDDPFRRAGDDYEVRLFDADGTLLGLAPQAQLS